MAEKKNKTIQKAREEMQYLTGEEEVRRLAELREKWESDYVDAKEFGLLEGREQGRAEGIAEGRREGRKEGKKEGKAEGIKQGIKEEKIKTAQQMKKNGLDIKLIEKITELTREEIEKIN